MSFATSKRFSAIFSFFDSKVSPYVGTKFEVPAYYGPHRTKPAIILP
jgi:hypothetical protein